jgi:hypothetical protein
MNEIMCVASLSGLRLYSIRESDMGEVEMTTEGQIRSLSYPGAPSRQRLSQIEFGGLDEAALAEFREVPPERLVGIARVAEKAIDTIVKSDCAGLLVEAQTLAEEGQYPQSFISSWLALEKHFLELWRSTNSIRAEPMSGRNHMASVLKELRSKSVIGDQHFERLETFRKKRNEISHERLTTSRQEAEACFKECVSVVGRDLGLIP